MSGARLDPLGIHVMPRPIDAFEAVRPRLDGATEGPCEARFLVLEKENYRDDAHRGDGLSLYSIESTSHFPSTLMRW